MFLGKCFSNAKTDNTTHEFSVDGSWVSVAFAPTDNVEQRIVDAITSAGVSVHVAMFTFTNNMIGQALVSAKQRGVQVEVLLDVHRPRHLQRAKILGNARRHAHDSTCHGSRICWR